MIANRIRLTKLNQDFYKVNKITRKDNLIWLIQHNIINHFI